MDSNPVARAIAEDEEVIAGIRINVKHRNQWAYVRLDILEEWAAERNELNVQARLEELACAYHGRPTGTPVRFGTGQFGGKLAAVWMNEEEQEATFEPEFDGTPDYYRPIVALQNSQTVMRHRRRMFVGISIYVALMVMSLVIRLWNLHIPALVYWPTDFVLSIVSAFIIQRWIRNEE